ncbi:MAG TPA: Imm27 family immunity protein [Candidatus Baltobacteraceae bacterium]|nr:Imm27 family immunity protein [Candidatus Baltobacteraceae bacterium]
MDRFDIAGRSVDVYGADRFPPPANVRVARLVPGDCKSVRIAAPADTASVRVAPLDSIESQSCEALEHALRIEFPNPFGYCAREIASSFMRGVALVGSGIVRRPAEPRVEISSAFARWLSLEPDERVVVGGAVLAEDGRVLPNATACLIAFLKHAILDRLAEADGGWRHLYFDSNDRRLWESSYPLAGMHGGGPQRLAAISLRKARERFGAFTVPVERDIVAPLDRSETRLVGQWTHAHIRDRRPNAVGRRIEHLTGARLTPLGHDASGWEQLFRDSADGRLWEATFYNSALQGGGPRMLSVIAQDAARRKYGDDVLG